MESGRGGSHLSRGKVLHEVDSVLHVSRTKTGTCTAADKPGQASEVGRSGERIPSFGLLSLA